MQLEEAVSAVAWQLRTIRGGLETSSLQWGPRAPWNTRGEVRAPWNTRGEAREPLKCVQLRALQRKLTSPALQLATHFSFNYEKLFIIRSSDSHSPLLKLATILWVVIYWCLKWLP